MLIQTQEDPQSLHLKRAELGDTVTLHCAALNETTQMLTWYKQSLGYNPQIVASTIFTSRTIYPSFNSRFNVGEETNFNLNITNVQKDDEANYFCHQGNHFKKIWTNGIFLTVNGNISVSIFHIFNFMSKTFSLKEPQLNFNLCLMMLVVFNCADHNDQRFVSQTVVQQPVLVSVQLGDPVALQCSITSQRTDHRNQCQGEPSVYWFRSGSGPSHPAVIYMNGNRSGECQDSSGPLSPPQSCVYTLHKNNVGTSDAGTYYCALAACGEIVFGQGTKLDITGQYILLPIFCLLDGNYFIKKIKDSSNSPLWKYVINKTYDEFAGL